MFPTDNDILDPIDFTTQLLHSTTKESDRRQHPITVPLCASGAMDIETQEKYQKCIKSTFRIGADVSWKPVDRNNISKSLQILMTAAAKSYSVTAPNDEKDVILSKRESYMRYMENVFRDLLLDSSEAIKIGVQRINKGELQELIKCVGGMEVIKPFLKLNGHRLICSILKLRAAYPEDQSTKDLLEYVIEITGVDVLKSSNQYTKELKNLEELPLLLAVSLGDKEATMLLIEKGGMNPHAVVKCKEFDGLTDAASLFCEYIDHGSSISGDIADDKDSTFSSSDYDVVQQWRKDFPKIKLIDADKSKDVQQQDKYLKTPAMKKQNRCSYRTKCHKRRN